MINKALFLTILASLGVLSASLCAPALPCIASHFSSGFFHTQLIISIFLIGNAIGQLLSGPFSDQIGQRKALLGGLCIFVLASCGCALSPSIGVMLVCRFFQGFGSAVGPVLARAIAVNSYSSDRSVQLQSYGAIGIGIASILAILASGQLTLLSWRNNFWLAGFLGAAVIIWTYYTFPASSIRFSNGLSLKRVFHQMKQVAAEKSFLRPALCHSISYGLMYGYIGLFPFMLIQQLGANPGLIGIYSAVMIVCYMLGAFASSRLAPRYSPGFLAISGVAIQAMSGAILSTSQAPILVLGGLALFNASLGLILPSTAAKALEPFRGSNVGTASSALGLLYRFLGALLSMLVCQYKAGLGFSILTLASISLLVMRSDETTEREASTL